MTQAIKSTDRDVLLVVDVQNDFCPGGRLAVPNGHEVVPIVNRIAGRFEHVVLTQDWHPAGHRLVASSHAGRRPLETVTLSYGEQVLARPLRAGHVRRRVPPRPRRPARRAGAAQGFSPRHRFLFGLLRERSHDPDRPRRLLARAAAHARFLAGLAFDFCVRYSAEDACRLGFEVFVIEDACRGIDVEDPSPARAGTWRPWR